MTTVKDELLQRDVEAFFKARADLLAGAKDISPEALTEALIRFVAALRASGEKVVDERFQALLSEYAKTLRQQQTAAGELGSTRYNGLLVRAACRSGLLVDLEEGAVGDLKPWQVTEFAKTINGAIGDAYRIPGE